MRVGALNLWRRRGAWDERRPVLIDGFRRLQPDLVAFQEAVVVDGYDQVTDILGTGYHVAHQAGRETDGMGLSIATRWEVGKVWEETSQVTPRVDPSKIAVAEILAPNSLGGTLLFAHHNASWQLSFERERELQAVAGSRLVEDLLGKLDVGVGPGADGRFGHQTRLDASRSAAGQAGPAPSRIG